MTLDEMRVDFIVRRKGSLALPMTGVINYAVAAALSLIAPAAWHNLILTICFFAIPPVGALISKLRGEQMTGGAENPLFRLSSFMRIMVLATWSVHIPIWFYAPDLFPLSVGVCFALHWVVFSWIVDHPLGFMQLGMRMVFVPAAWLAVPANRMGAVAAAVSICYAVSAFQLSRIRWAERLPGFPGTVARAAA
jgi:hypothetical protein